MTPDNGMWYHITYAVSVVFYAGYIFSLWKRRKNLGKDRNL